jgi:hypothetical protein
MKYLILIYSNPTTRKIWEGMSDAQRAEGCVRAARWRGD